MNVLAAMFISILEKEISKYGPEIADCIIKTIGDLAEEIFNVISSKFNSLHSDEKDEQ